MRIDALSFMAIMAIVLPAVATVALALGWRRWKAPTAAKVLITIGTFVLVVPGTCVGLAGGHRAAAGRGEVAPLLHHLDHDLVRQRQRRGVLRV